MWTTNIQYKGTDLCMDFICPACGCNQHIDGFFHSVIECEGCHKCWKMPTDVGSLLVVEGKHSEWRRR